MATGTKQNNVVQGQGASVEDLFGIDFGDLTNATRLNLQAEIKNGPIRTFAVLYYSGTGALTLSEFNNLPVGSYIIDFQAFKIHLKTGSTTWKSSAAMS